MGKKALIATGGTGGHIFPAIVTAEELRIRGWEVAFIGSFGAAADKIMSRGFKCSNITVKGFVAKGPGESLAAVFFLVKAFFSCLRYMLTSRPDIILGFGGYSSFPAVFMGRLLGIKAMIHEQNVCPGLANKVLANFVNKVAVSFRDSQAAFPKGRAVWTGCPVRPLSSVRGREPILTGFGLEFNRKTMLVFGGSQGSRAINRCVAECFTKPDFLAGWQVIHISGKGLADDLKAGYSSMGVPAYVKEFMDNIEDAYAVADIVIARSGAGTVTELGLLGICAVLIPYPFARSHQLANAQILARHSAAVIIQEKDLNPAILGDKIFLVLNTNLSREKMRARLTGDFACDAAQRVSDELEGLL